jgi:MFS family permease
MTGPTRLLDGRLTPLLLLTFALSAGDAFETPTWRAVLPELVQKEDLPAASALNGIEFNFARAVGPALAGLVIAFAGIGAAFVLNAASFAGVILVVARWKRTVVKRTTPPETVTGATVAAIRWEPLQRVSGLTGLSYGRESEPSCRRCSDCFCDCPMWTSI